jgi:hypothetical protein
MVSVLAIRPKVRGLKPGRDDGFLRAISVAGLLQTGSKPLVPCRKIL